MAVQYLKRTRTRNSLPYDLLHIIINLLISTDSLGTLAALQRCSQAYYDLITPLLYTHVHIHSDDQLQRFLTLPSESRTRRKSKGFSLLSSKAMKRARSGSLQTPEKKLQALTLVKSLTLDVYPSRTSLKLASKLPQVIPAKFLTFTPSAVLSLHAKLLRSQAPRILATFWAGHLPSLIQPQQVTINYSSLDVRTLLQGDKKENWWDTFGGLSVALQHWEKLEKIELRGEVWGLIVPSPGVEMEMVHTTFVPNEDVVDEAIMFEEGDESDGNNDIPQDGIHSSTPVQIPNPNIAVLPQAANNNDNADDTLTPRQKLLKDRKEALLLGLLANYQVVQHTQHQALATHPNHLTSYVPQHFITNGRRSRMLWKLKGFFPPPDGDVDEDGIEWKSDDEKREELENDRKEVASWLMNELDQQCPELARDYGRMIDGRRELDCLQWIS
ncbi:expressed protein [Cryptococcus deneoformans JEC21]|uniref:Expressed protein n=1 Tax=Cryptococcus deneoformans (strain JEC21 / ATCC MYA-565) TaxID=214684 RepID=Q5KH25_CRYD1|nr:expressed protein [Cryptococcus neoformans var. neoformans JEC21]AAW43452.1 expressed protein [Cryptococcus neoformans var. neoformans JEC21]